MEIPRDFEPADICGGVWVNELQAFVPVEPGERIDFVNENHDFALWEYKVPNGHEQAGQVRACLQLIARSSDTAALRLTDLGRTDGYTETASQVHGHGHMRKLNRQGSEANILSASFKYRQAHANPGDTIQFVNGEHHYTKDRLLGSFAVLTTFNDAPFRRSYEIVVG